MKRKHPLIIVADMGATYSRVAFIDEYYAIRHIETYLSANFASPKEVISTYLNDINEEMPDHVFIAVATPISNDHLVLTNNHWDFSQNETAQALNTKVTFVNDFEALSLSLNHLSQTETIEIGTHTPKASQLLNSLPKIVIGTGTGFGTAMIIEGTQGASPISLPSEGGHALYAPQDSEEIKIIELAINALDRPIIVEDFLGCKSGIPRLITIMAEIENIRPNFPIDAIGLLSAALEHKNDFAIKVLNRYCSMLGNVASNIALTAGAFGGIYIGGGFAPRFSEFLQNSGFREAFLNKASVNNLLEETPTYLIIHPYATLVGLQQILTRYL